MWAIDLPSALWVAAPTIDLPATGRSSGRAIRRIRGERALSWRVIQQKTRSVARTHIPERDSGCHDHDGAVRPRSIISIRRCRQFDPAEEQDHTEHGHREQTEQRVYGAR